MSKEETTRWQGLKNRTFRSDYEELAAWPQKFWPQNKPFRHLVRVRQTFSKKGMRKHNHIKHIDARPLKRRKKPNLILFRLGGKSL